MSHCIHAVVAEGDLAEGFARDHRLSAPIPLEQGFAVVPVFDVDLDALFPGPQTGHVEGFVHLSAQLADLLRRASTAGALVYLETEYFGGLGTQAAVAYCNGRVVSAPRAAESGPINDALRAIGVRVLPSAYDEFASVGLHHHRSFDRDDP